MYLISEGQDLDRGFCSSQKYGERVPKYKSGDIHGAYLWYSDEPEIWHIGFGWPGRQLRYNIQAFDNLKGAYCQSRRLETRCQY